ncbi:MAG TPA: transcription termination/antitermination protein NusG [Thermomicrobiaceae bacterium]|nr:transcription termination/antitermination protein NusG [Thermomicrobiaceae bacterium]
MTRSLRERLAQRREAQAEAEGTAQPGDWFVVHTYSGYENKVRQNLLHRVETMDVTDKIFEVVVPTQEEVEISGGQRRSVQRKVFPGYVLVRMLMDDDSWYVVRNTPGVTSFVGMGNKPTPLGENEVQIILKGMTAPAPKVKVSLSLGDTVRIVDGPFSDFRGSIDEIDHEKAKVKVLVSFFGRETPVTLDFLQVERED